MKDYSYVFNAHPSVIDKLYKTYKDDPGSVEQGWRAFFSGFDFQTNGGVDAAADREVPVGKLEKEFDVLSIIHGFRDRGHLLSTTNPIKKRKDRKPHLDLEDYNLDESDLDEVFIAGEEIGMKNASLREILKRLNTLYASNIGYEYVHIEDNEKRMWLRDKIENRNLADDYGLSIEMKKRILDKLNDATIFEKFLHTKYVGQKRFSLEGGESTIPALDAIINYGAQDIVEEVVIGMAHRGRLNVLANIMCKTYEEIFTEFEGNAVPELAFGDGDVKYHLGYNSQIEASNGRKIQMRLMANPSHLEAVDPVVEGFSRAKADILYDSEYDKILPVLIHGDAAIAGQGVAYETVQMSKLDGYYTGGTVHFVINNQIGFTTDFDDARSSTYCTGAANVIQAPVFHVNGDDVEAVVHSVLLAMEYRQKFNNDVFIDMVCYRKHGHNEGDDPKFTQPKMYKIIKDHKNPREIYVDKLIKRDHVEKKMAEELENSFWKKLQDRLDMVKETPLPYAHQEPEKAWKALRVTKDPNDFIKSPKTGIAEEKLDFILNHITNLPEDFNPVPKVHRLFKGMNKLLAKDMLDWGLAEMAAYGSILLDKRNVRMSGQDVKRGTFSHRHAMVYDSKSYKSLNRLDGMTEDQGRFMIYNSLLSEFAVMGFEYGYSLATPDALVIWEAQFGDFYNGAQTIVDQFISAGESKWRNMSGLVLLLPHGYEGQGPEHSSARLERFLMMCAEYNLAVTNITTPANFFHAMRRQLDRPFRKPLINMAPKSLLRHPKCVSKKSEFYKGNRFQELIDDDKTLAAKKVTRVILCSGKVYYDLLEKKEETKRQDVALVRIEQLYPLPEFQLDDVRKKYSNAEFYWVQEEPENMGANRYIRHSLSGWDLTTISREASASPATGFKTIHDEQQANLIDKAFRD
ncbi:2-oxoglutarate dehydrogenase E1 component [Membranicola marinus]|uniref:oxoglutarate dehydrogenase (succinyl-transferring) n=1 Tax=Membranihabitans marinus TaxID=1227546 RepID=A0A953LB70_9BACT|nr:2-oxoglutarate dehydrogenase E1 component [Membranihabitans marinus]MBY5958286.1 2-oxoglutarate dehydrogenase E1 component [Membranihabitans marinus]